MRIEHHPIGVWVREDGCVYLPQSGKHPAHWTYGSKNRWGYLLVGISGKIYHAHRLVAEAFLPNPKNLHEVDHINRDTRDNRVENLRWVSRSGNTRNTVSHDRVEFRGGVHSYVDFKKHRSEVCKTSYNLKRKTHKHLVFSDGKQRWVPNEQALELLKLPVKERIYDKV